MKGNSSGAMTSSKYARSLSDVGGAPSAGEFSRQFSADRMGGVEGSPSFEFNILRLANSVGASIPICGKFRMVQRLAAIVRISGWKLQRKLVGAARLRPPNVRMEYANLRLKPEWRDRVGRAQ